MTFVSTTGRTSGFKTRWLTGAAMLIWFAAMGLAAPLRAATPIDGDPMLRVQHGVNDMLAVFKDERMPLPQRRERLRAMAADDFDFDDMARSVMGYHWRELSPAQRAEFVPLFTSFLEDAYLSKLQDYVVKKIQDEARTTVISFTRESFDSADYAEVFGSVALKEQKDPLRINFLLHRRDGVWRAYDITIEAISIISNYRNQFNRVINEDGYPKLVADLKIKRDAFERAMAHPDLGPSRN
jgi:phospholipid transport system substrate-binding protein